MISKLLWGAVFGFLGYELYEHTYGSVATNAALSDANVVSSAAALSSYLNANGCPLGAPTDAFTNLVAQFQNALANTKAQALTIPSSEFGFYMPQTAARLTQVLAAHGSANPVPAGCA